MQETIKASSSSSVFRFFGHARFASLSSEWSLQLTCLCAPCLHDNSKLLSFGIVDNKELDNFTSMFRWIESSFRRTFTSIWYKWLMVVSHSVFYSNKFMVWKLWPSVVCVASKILGSLGIEPVTDDIEDETYHKWELIWFRYIVNLNLNLIYQKHICLTTRKT